MAAIITILLLAILFIVGLINTVYYLPPKKLYAVFFSYFFSKTSSADSISTTSTVKAPPMKQMNAKKKEELKRVFATFDKDGDGFITKKELRESLKGIGMVMTEKEVEEMVQKLDANGDGLIDLDEFCDLFESMVKREKVRGDELEEDDDDDDDGGEEELKEAFDVFDGDRDGLITVEELGMVLSNLGLKEGKKKEDCKEMIRKVDLDGDGMVNFDEFKRMMKAGGALVSVF